MHTITVNRHIIAKNRKTGTTKPPLRTAKGRYGKPRYTDHIEFAGARGRIVYRPEQPLPCGATVWIEFDEGEFC